MSVQLFRNSIFCKSIVSRLLLFSYKSQPTTTGSHSSVSPTQHYSSVTRFLKLRSVTMRKPSEYKWVTCAVSGLPPPGAIEGGFDKDSKLFVIRAYHENGLIPGKLHLTHNKAYVSIGGKEYIKDSYEVLTAPFGYLGWIDSCGGNNIPRSAVIGGMSTEGETLYVGRVEHMGTLTIGKVHPSHGSCYIPYDGIEFAFQHYEILVEISHCETERAQL